MSLVMSLIASFSLQQNVVLPFYKPGGRPNGTDKSFESRLTDYFSLI
jgi:hypothetical protein